MATMPAVMLLLRHRGTMLQLVVVIALAGVMASLLMIRLISTVTTSSPASSSSSGTNNLLALPPFTRTGRTELQHKQQQQRVTSIDSGFQSMGNTKQLLDSTHNSIDSSSRLGHGGAGSLPMAHPSQPSGAVVVVAPASPSLGTKSPPTPAPCWRVCPAGRRINRIVYDPPPDGAVAGLLDRQYVMYGLGNLAGYLCAQVVFPPPFRMLDLQHNQGQPVDNQSRWEDYIIMTFQQDGEWVLVDQVDDDNNNNAAPHRRELMETKSPEQVSRHFQQAQDYWLRNISFVWTWKSIFYPTMEVLGHALRMQRNSHTGDVRAESSGQHLPDMWWSPRFCQYVWQSVPDHSQLVADSIWGVILRRTQPRRGGPSNGTQFTRSRIGKLHIRRNDAQQECNTTLPRVQTYLTCSLRKLQLAGYNTTILLATDEQDVSYRQSIQNMLETMGMGFIDLDRLIKEEANKASATNLVPSYRNNNFYLFKVGCVLESKVHFTLELRRNVQCNDCDEVVSV